MPKSFISPLLVTISLLLSILVESLFPLRAWAASYSKCMVPDEFYRAQAADFCVPENQGQVAPARIDSGTEFVIGPVVAGAPLVLVLPARNCRTKTENYLGDVVLLLDNSQSLEKTDPNDERMQGTAGFIDELKTRAQSTPDAPNLGVIAYGGRMRFTKSDPNRIGKPEYVKRENEAYSPAYNDLPCIDGDDSNILGQLFGATSSRQSMAGKFDSPDAKARWNERVSATDIYPLSICEFLRNVSAKTDSTADLSVPGMTRQREFFQLPAGAPRGATDVSYMIETASTDQLLGSSNERSRQAIFITDGLPNTPVRRTKDYCLSAPHLPKTDFESDDLSPVEELFCLDRNFREGVNSAHAAALSKMTSVNLHHILYWSKPGESFIDFDEKGTLNPADFLIENSARTGNGKVKFQFAQGPEKLKQALINLLPALDQAALQRVDITVTDAQGVVHPKYSAVSPIGFARDLAADPQDKRFDLKILYLSGASNGGPGINTVRIDYVYSDRTVTENLTVRVMPSFQSTSAMRCTEASSSFTVDGDRKDYPVCLKRDPRDIIPAPPAECVSNNAPAQCECKAPAGDGFLPFPDENGNIRVYRNSDPSNEEFENQDQFARVAEYGSEDGQPKAQNLRIQGGTGNCGVIGGLDAQSLMVDGKNSSYASRARLVGAFLLAFPLFIAIFWQGFSSLFARPWLLRLKRARSEKRK